jgi:hypothetical protein
MNTFEKATELVEENMTTIERTKLYVVGVTFWTLAFTGLYMIVKKIIRK